jgi:hypothetical protein
MRNDFHLVLETPNANLVAGMRWLLSTYSLASISTSPARSSAAEA